MLLQVIRAFPGSEIRVSSSAVLHGRLPAKPPGSQRDQRGNLKHLQNSFSICGRGVSVADFNYF